MADAGYGAGPVPGDPSWWVQVIDSVPPEYRWTVLLPMIPVVASVVVSMTPTPRDDEMLGKVYRAVEYAALMFGRAKEPAPKEKE